MDKRWESKISYIVEHIGWIFLSMVLYRGFVFRKLDFTNYFVSCLILDGLLVLCSIIGGIYDLRYQRRRRGIFYNLFLAYGIYTCMSYHFVFKKLMMAVIGIVIVLTVVCLLALYYRYITSLRYEANYVKRQVHLGIYACRRNFAYAMLLIMVIIGGRIVFTDSVASASTEVLDAYGQDYNFENNANEIAKIRPEVWETLEFQEKMNVAQIIANCEGNYLGIPQMMTVVANDLESYVLGQYVEGTYRIEISTEHIKNSSPEAVLNTILHESYHCYQEQCIKVYEKLSPEERNLMLFYHTAKYSDEFNNYKDGSEDMEEYWNQQVEIDAREYAKNGVEEYYRLINEAVLKGEVQ